jgi:hypothetical protein
VVCIYFVPTTSSSYVTCTVYLSSTSSGGTVVSEITSPESTSAYSCITLYLPAGWYYGIKFSSTSATCTCEYQLL